METLGERLRRVKKARGVDNSAIAAAAGVHPKTVSRWLNDKSDPDPRELDGAAAFLGVTADWLRKGDVTAERHPLDRASVERPLPRVVRSHAVRVWLKEFELELTRAGVPDERIAEAIDLVTAPSVFRYFAGGAVREMDEERAVRAMETLARIVRMRAREEGYTVPEPST